MDQTELMPEYLWELVLKSDEVIEVKPSSVAHVQKCLAERQVINTKMRSIVYSEIKDFRITDRVYTDRKLIAETAAQAFNEPLLYGDSIACSWVKKSVPRRRWDTYYRFIPSYRRLVDGDQYVTMAFRLPVHLINNDFVVKLTPDEERTLNPVR